MKSLNFANIQFYIVTIEFINEVWNECLPHSFHIQVLGKTFYTWAS
jgi:hypothetical protein